jgi:hypothetical protein
MTSNVSSFSPTLKPFSVPFSPAASTGASSAADFSVNEHRQPPRKRAARQRRGEQRLGSFMPCPNSTPPHHTRARLSTSLQLFFVNKTSFSSHGWRPDVSRASTPSPRKLRSGLGCLRFVSCSLFLSKCVSFEVRHTQHTAPFSGANISFIIITSSPPPPGAARNACAPGVGAQHPRPSPQTFLCTPLSPSKR